MLGYVLPALLLLAGCWQAAADATPGLTETAAPAAAPTDTLALPWLAFDEALAVAAGNGRKILVDVYAPWCPWCQKLQNEVQPSPAVRAYLTETFVLARVNGDDTEQTIEVYGHTVTGQQLAHALGTESYPLTVFLDSDGSAIVRVPGFREADDYLMVAKYIGSDAFLTMTFEEFVASN
jgi:thioredoxin-related protein